MANNLPNQVEDPVSVIVEAVQSSNPEVPSASIASKAIVETIIEEMGGFSMEKIPLILPKLIIHVQIYKHMNGEQKKKTIISMLKHIVDITDGPGNDAIWDPIIKKLIPGMIDALIEVNNGKLKLKKRKGRFWLCC